MSNQSRASSIGSTRSWRIFCAAGFKDVELAVAAGVQHESEKGRSLAGRRSKPIEAFTGGHAALEEGVKKVWQDFDGLSAANKEKVRLCNAAFGAEMSAFIAKAMAVRDQKK